MKNDYIMPILVLAMICMLVSGALALCNSFTEPVIAEADAQRAQAAREDVIPGAGGFTQISVDGLPASVTQVFEAANGAGYIFMLTTSGYGGEIRLICGIDATGKLIKCAMLANAETKGLGTRVFEDAYTSRFIGLDSRLEGVAAITGATITSNAYKNAILDAFAAYEAVSGL
ncbi:MAG: FMN-binding protein [Clostridiales bacterium]|nr:FMN-binding protein [Clostridiales bacterium]